MGTLLKRGVSQREEESPCCVADGVANMRKQRIVKFDQSAIGVRVLGRLQLSQHIRDGNASRPGQR